MITSILQSAHRFRSALIVVAAAAAAGSIVYVVWLPDHTFEPAAPPLRRSNAVRRPRHSSDNAPPTEHEGAGHVPTTDSVVLQADDSLTEQDLQDDPVDQVQQGQKLYQLLYYVQKSRLENEGVVHRGITCDGCAKVPIRGVRFRCCNCPDFDLCEDCESQDIHQKTHVFYKIKVPAPWYGKEPLPVWYPGKPQVLPTEPKEELKQRLISDHKCSREEIYGLYVQFSCVAETRFEDDPCELKWAISRSAFDHCFLPQASRFRATSRHSLVFDRLFSFYDTDRNGLIGFEEFLSATLLIHSRDPHKRTARIFRALDLDDDGFVSRSDFLRFFRAYHSLNRDLILDAFRMERDGEDWTRVLDRNTPQDVIRGGRSLSAFYSDGYAEFQRNTESAVHKHIDRHGDLVPPADGQRGQMPAVSDLNSDHIPLKDIVGRSWTDPYNEMEVEIAYATNHDASGQRWGIGTTMIVAGAFGEERLREDEGKLYVKWEPRDRRVLDRTVYIEVSDDVIENVLGQNVDWHDHMEDENFSELVKDATTAKCVTFVRESRLNERLKHLSEREEHSPFLIDGEVERLQLENDISDAPTNGKRDHQGQKEVIEHGTANFQGRPRNRSFQGMPDFKGSVQAIESIYEISHEGLNELLDPLFNAVETKALHFRRQQPLCEQYKDEIEAFQTANDDLLRSNLDQTEGVQGSRLSLCSRILQARQQTGKDVRFISELMKTDLESLTNAGFNPKAISVDSLEPSWQEYRKLIDDSLFTDDETLDPTMPQHRPDAAILELLNSKDIHPFRDPIRLITFLATQSGVKREELKKGGLGRLDFAEFNAAIEQSVDAQNRLLSWVEHWLHLVQF